MVEVASATLADDLHLAGCFEALEKLDGLAHLETESRTQLLGSQRIAASREGAKLRALG
jgi:hypothetical protein